MDTDFTYSLIRTLPEREKEADASNDVRVYYKMPTIEVIEGGETLEKCKETLKTIEDEVNYFKGLKEKRQSIYELHKTKSRSKIDEKVGELEKELLASDNKYIKSLYIGFGRLWYAIDDKLKELAGEYMIIPTIYKNL